jgi:hypothetical protein
MLEQTDSIVETRSGRLLRNISDLKENVHFDFFVFHPMFLVNGI